MNAHSHLPKTAAPQWRTLATAVVVVAATVLAAHPADATPIPTTTAMADEMVVNFDTSRLALPAQGLFTFVLATTGLDAGDSIVVDLFAGANGQNFIANAYTGPFVTLSGNCTIGGFLCSYLLDGDFSIGLRMASGATDLVSAYAFAVDANGARTPMIQGTRGVTAASLATVAEPGTASLVAIASLPLMLYLRRRHGSAALPQRRRG